MQNNIEEKIGYTFRNYKHLELALTHSSYSSQKGSGHLGCNERLEFLSDSVLGFTVAEYLFKHFPQLPEGDLTRIRSNYVCETNLAKCAELFSLGDYLLLGNGEDATGGRKRASVVSDAFESVIAAIYLDGGMEPAKEFIYRFVLSNDNPETKNCDYKSRLQEFVQKEKNVTISYVLVEESGPDHDKYFKTAVLVNNQTAGIGEGKSKKKSEQEAAKQALTELQK